MGDPERMPPATKDMYKYVAAEAEKANVRVQNGEKINNGTVSISHLKTDEQNQIKASMISDEFIKMQKDVNKTSVRDRTNPYQAPTFETLIERPAFADTKLGQYALTLKQATPNLPMTPIDILNHAKYMLTSGQYKSPAGQPAFKTKWTGPIEAAVNDLEIYFQEIMNHNNGHYQFSYWNLPVQREYGDGSGKNYADRAILVREMVKHIASEKIGTIVVNPFSMPK